MVLLTIALEVKTGRTAQLTENFSKQFLPVVSRRPGFAGAQLARELEAPQHMLILLFFETEQQRLDWVASPQHDPAWNAIASLCDGYTPVSYEVVAGNPAQYERQHG